MYGQQTEKGVIVPFSRKAEFRRALKPLREHLERVAGELEDTEFPRPMSFLVSSKFGEVLGVPYAEREGLVQFVHEVDEADVVDFPINMRTVTDPSADPLEDPIFDTDRSSTLAVAALHWGRKELLKILPETIPSMVEIADFTKHQMNGIPLSKRILLPEEA